MRILTAALAVFLLCCAPVSAQTGVPHVPTPQPSSGSGIIGELNQATETLVESAQAIGTQNVLQLMAGAGMLAIISGFLFFVARPLLKNANDAQQELSKTQGLLTQVLTNQQTLQTQREAQYVALVVDTNGVKQRNTQAFEGLKTSMDARTEQDKQIVAAMERWDQSQTKMKTLIQVWKEEGFKTLTDHVDTGHEDIHRRLDGIILMLQALKIQVPPQAMRVEAIINEVKQVKSGDTGKLPPLSSITDQDPGKPPTNDKQKPEA